MPYTHNGIGTWYYGKQNVHVFRGTCQHCGRATELSTYDTTLYFVVLFIPVIPLGRKKIINYCPLCTRHGAMPLAKWEKLRASSIDEAVKAYCQAPFDAEKARAALNTVVSFRAKEALQGLATLLDASFPSDPAMQALLASAHEFCGNTLDAAEAYRKSLRVKPDPEVNDALAMLYLRDTDAEAAAPLLAYILRDKFRAKVPLLLLLVEAYQARGMHGQASQLLKGIVETFPDAATDAALVSLQKTADRYGSTSHPVKPAHLARSTDGFRATSLWRARLPRAVPVALLLLVIGLYLALAIGKGLSRTVYLVNGLSRPYAVEIAGQRHVLPPQSWQPVTLPEGTHTFSVSGDGVFIPSQKAEIHTPFFTRPFTSPAIVLNPDRTAMLELASAVYSPSGHDEPPPSDLRTGQFVQVVSGMDYIFENFPDSIQTQQSSGTITKHRLGIVRNLTGGNALLVVTEHLGPQAAKDYLRCRLTADPADEACFAYLHILSPQEALALLRPRLADRPVRIEWHRAYQSLSEAASPTQDLQKEYAALLAADPNNGALQYLLGRMTKDRAKARELFQKAAAATPPVAYAHHALAYDAFAVGRFSEAAASWQRAIAIDPQPAFQDSYTESLIATGQYETALALCRRRLAAVTRDQDLLVHNHLATAEIELLALLKRPDEARQRIAAHVAQVKDPQGAATSRHYLAATLAYATGDVATYTAEAAHEPSDHTKFVLAITQHKIADASTLLSGKEPSNDALAHLIVYALAASEGPAELATKHLATATTLLRGGSPEQRQAANWLSAAVPPTLEATRELNLSPVEKRILLVALARRHPAQAADYLAQARLFDFSPQFPHLTIKEILYAKVP